MEVIVYKYRQRLKPVSVLMSIYSVQHYNSETRFSIFYSPDCIFYLLLWCILQTYRRVTLWKKILLSIVLRKYSRKRGQADKARGCFSDSFVSKLTSKSPQTCHLEASLLFRHHKAQPVCWFQWKLPLASVSFLAIWSIYLVNLIKLLVKIFHIKSSKIQK